MLEQPRGEVMRRNKSRSRISDILIPGLLAVFQIIFWLVILILEAVNVSYHAGRGTIYAGFWCSIVFFVTWIAMLSSVCCGKSFSYKVYLLIQNIINAIFAIILISFTARFIDDPCLCYGILCIIPPHDDIFSGSISSANNDYCITKASKKLPLLKGLLSCAVLMLVSNLLFILFFIFNYIRSRSKPAPPIPSRQRPNIPVSQPTPIVTSTNQYEQPPLVKTVSETGYYISTNDPIPSTPTEIRVVKF